MIVALALGVSGVAHAQQRGAPVRVTAEPVISGNPFIGSALVATGGAWQSPNPEASRTQSWWEWWRCPRTDRFWGCDFRTRDASYAISSPDAGEYLLLARYVRWLDTRNTPDTRDDRWVQDVEVSAPVGPVRAAPPPPPPAPPPAPTPTPAPQPTPVPAFDTVAAAPVTTQGEVLQETARKRRVLRPFPIVRMKGRLTTRGAKVQVLSVRAPRAAKISVRCRGKSCPASRWSRSHRKSRLTRMARYERSLRAGVKLTVSVTRRGYVGKRTTFVIRRGAAPLRSDRCLSSKGRVTRCPSGVS